MSLLQNFTRTQEGMQMSLEGLQLGHYRLTRQIGSGAMSEVYLAEDTRISRQVAVKVVRYEASPYPNAEATREVERLFQREMQMISKLDHPHILSLFDFGDEKIQGTTYTYMVMPYRAEGSLADWLRKQGGALPRAEDVSHLLTQAADALQYAHDQGLVHQDVKPSNFLIRQRPDHPNRPDLLLADFGIAKIANATTAASQNTRGTPSYMPPEQWSAQPVPASDQYALAIMAYQLLTGQLPFRGNPMQTMQQHYTATPTPPSRLNPRLSHALDAVVLRALAKKPEERFPSIISFAQAFRQALDYKGVLRATLAIRSSEALAGTSRTLTLPGKRQVTVYIPSNTQNGQEIHLAEQGEAFYEGGPRGPLILTVSISDREGIAAPANQPSGTIPVSPPPVPEQKPQQGPVSQSGVQNASWNNMPPPPPPTPVQRPQQEQPSWPGTQNSAWNLQQSTPQMPLPPQAVLTPPRPKYSLALVALLIIMVALLVLGGGGWLVYSTQIAPVHQQATAIAQNQTATVVQQATEAHLPANLTATAQAGTTATAIAANPDPYPPHSAKIALIDPLTKAYLWQNYKASDLTCQYQSGSYHITETKNFVNGCAASTPEYSDFTLEVQMTILQGYCGGLTFRGDTSLKNLYDFEICTGRKYFLGVYQNSQVTKRLINNKTSSAIHIGLNQVNTLAVVVTGSKIDLYVNNQKIDSATDTTYTRGRFFLVVENTTDRTEASFSNMRLWTP
jgi:serine/threonine protein kinase